MPYISHRIERTHGEDEIMLTRSMKIAAAERSEMNAERSEMNVEVVQTIDDVAGEIKHF